MPAQGIYESLDLPPEPRFYSSTDIAETKHKKKVKLNVDKKSYWTE